MCCMHSFNYLFKLSIIWPGGIILSNVQSNCGGWGVSLWSCYSVAVVFLCTYYSVVTRSGGGEGTCAGAHGHVFPSHLCHMGQGAMSADACSLFRN